MRIYTPYNIVADLSRHPNLGSTRTGRQVIVVSQRASRYCEAEVERLHHGAPSRPEAQLLVNSPGRELIIFFF